MPTFLRWAFFFGAAERPPYFLNSNALVGRPWHVGCSSKEYLLKPPGRLGTPYPLTPFQVAFFPRYRVPFSLAKRQNLTEPKFSN